VHDLATAGVTFAPKSAIFSAARTVRLNQHLEISQVELADMEMLGLKTLDRLYALIVQRAGMSENTMRGVYFCWYDEGARENRGMSPGRVMRYIPGGADVMHVSGAMCPINTKFPGGEARMFGIGKSLHLQ
jgi:hypothetical protein